MKFLGAAGAFAGFVALAVASEALLAATHVPFSSAVLGLVVLLAFLILRRRIDAPVEEAANAVLTWFPLLFVPASVGVMAFGGLLAHSWLGIGVALIVSTLLGITVAASVGTMVARELGEEP